MARLLGTVFIWCVAMSLGYSQNGIHSIRLLGVAVSDKNIISDLIEVHYAGEVKYSDIVSLKTLDKHGVRYVIGEIRNELPEVIYKSFVIFSSDNKAFIIGLSFSEILERNNSSDYLLGGIYRYRGVGYYYVYAVSNDTCNLIFKSDVPVFNTSLGSESFKDGKLKLMFKDLNDDGCKDLSFRGTKLIYCVGEQSGRTDDHIVREEDVDFCYLFNCNAKIKHFVMCPMRK
jgi:hypothetical protein